MTISPRLLFIHGKDGSSQGFKVQHLRQLYPDLLAPDFPGDFWQRMARLEQVIGADGRLATHRAGSSMGRRRPSLPASIRAEVGVQAGAAGPWRWPSSTWPEPAAALAMRPR